jgi:hypothetical protein
MANELDIGKLFDKLDQEDIDEFEDKIDSKFRAHKNSKPQKGLVKFSKVEANKDRLMMDMLIKSQNMQ